MSGDNKIKSIFNKIYTIFPRIIIDSQRKLGNFRLNHVSYKTNLVKEAVSRKYLFEMHGNNLKFLDVGGKDGSLRYLLGTYKNLVFDQTYYTKNKILFDKKFNYYGMDLIPVNNKNVLVGDICNSEYLNDYPEFNNYFDFIYSNNVFEHLKKPWVAAENLTKMLKSNGIVVTIVPFSQRYHEDPEDYFRYTTQGVISLFNEYSDYEIIESGYDICGRRTNWQGSGENNDIVPLDRFGAWRETWFSVIVLRKN
jgi:SAM-dependent methyltransferase